MHPHDDDPDLPEMKVLSREMAPPPALEDRTLDALHRRGLLAVRARRGWRRAAALLALMASAAAAGWLARGVPAGRQDAGPRFVLLLYGDAQGHASPDAAVREYGAWARELAGTGTAVSGERLANEAVVVGAPIEAVSVRGYFIVHTADERRAVEIAATHPHVKRGGTIIVRRMARS
jgi:hypothetical protein